MKQKQIKYIISYEAPNDGTIEEVAYEDRNEAKQMLAIIKLANQSKPIYKNVVFKKVSTEILQTL